VFVRGDRVLAGWLTRDASTAVALGLDERRRMPSESVFRRVIARLDPLVLDGLIGAWMWTTTRVVQGRRVIAIDGKTVRGARTGGASAPHLVAAFDHTAGAVLGQVAVAAKTNEIPTVRTLLRFLDRNGGRNDGLAGAVVTIDAMHTQDDSAALIPSVDGDYVFTVKNNRPTLRTALKAIPWKDVPAYSYTEQTKGRRVRRTIKVAAVPAWVTFPGAAQPRSPSCVAPSPSRARPPSRWST